MKKQDRLTKSVRDELQVHCDAIRKLATDMGTGPESVAVLQHGLMSMLSTCDESTRTYIYTMVDNLLNAETEVEREHYIDASTMAGFDKFKSHIRVGVITKKLIDTFLADVKGINSLDVDKSEIYRTVIMRLLMELPSDSINDLLTRIAPQVSQNKVTEASRHMYG